MSRKIKQNRISLNKIFKELTEVFDSDIPTQFKTIDYGDYIAYNFITNSGTEYDLEFHYTDERCNTMLSNDKTLKNTLNGECDKGNVVGFDISFTMTLVENKHNPDEFEKETNKGEFIELFGRITNIIKRVVKTYSKNNLFVVGYYRRNKNDIYRRIFENHFSDEFEVFTGKSKWHPNGLSLFIIRKK